MPKKRSHPMPPLHEISQDYGGIEAGLSQCGLMTVRQQNHPQLNRAGRAYDQD